MSTVKNIWNELSKPIFVLAPMDDVTDIAFRRLVHEIAPADLYFTEFASVDGLMSPGREAVERKLRFNSEHEGPLIAQVWGMRPDNYYRAAQELVERGFDGLDINMGCPVPAVIKMGACSALIDNRELAGEIIQATKEGAAGRVPVSVKTRLGFSREDPAWIEFLLRQGVAALTVHARISVEMSKKPARWEAFDELKPLRDETAPETLLLGNGDVLSRAQGEELTEHYDLDGVMIARGIFQDPWIFSKERKERTVQEKLDLLCRHLSLYEEIWQENKNYHVLKKFFKIYANGFDGAANLRAELMETDTHDDARQVVQRFFSK